MEKTKNIQDSEVIQLIPESEQNFVNLLVEILGKHIIESNRIHTDIDKGSIQFLHTGTK